MTIQTERLTIKPFDAADEREILRILTDESVKKTYLVPDFPSEEDGMKMACRFRKLSESEEHCVAGIYHDRKLVGFINDVEIAEDYTELGYVIAPAHQNKGYATEAFRAVIDYLFEKGCREIITGAFVSNGASIRVMEKCGMTKMNKRAEIEYRGKLHPCVYYSIFRKK